MRPKIYISFLLRTLKVCTKKYTSRQQSIASVKSHVILTHYRILQQDAPILIKRPLAFLSHYVISYFKYPIRLGLHPLIAQTTLLKVSPESAPRYIHYYSTMIRVIQDGFCKRASINTSES